MDSLSRHPFGKGQSARKGHNGNKSFPGRKRGESRRVFPFSPSRVIFPPLVLSRVVFDLGWIDETRDTGGIVSSRRRYTRLSNERKRSLNARRKSETRERGEREGESGFRRATQGGKKRGSLRKPRRDTSSLRECRSSRRAVVHLRTTTDFSTLENAEYCRSYFALHSRRVHGPLLSRFTNFRLRAKHKRVYAHHRSEPRCELCPPSFTNTLLVTLLLFEPRAIYHRQTK